MCRTAMGDAAVDDIELLLVRREADTVGLDEVIDDNRDASALRMAPNGPSVAAAAALNARPDAVTADAAKKARLSMFPPMSPRFSPGSVETGAVLPPD